MPVHWAQRAQWAQGSQPKNMKYNFTLKINCQFDKKSISKLRGCESIWLTAREEINFWTASALLHHFIKCGKLVQKHFSTNFLTFSQPTTPLRQTTQADISTQRHQEKNKHNDNDGDVGDNEQWSNEACFTMACLGTHLPALHNLSGPSFQHLHTSHLHTHWWQDQQVFTRFCHIQ